MKPKKKDETKTDPPPTKDEDHGRVTAETVVTDGRVGIIRARELMRRLLSSRGHQAPEEVS